MLIEFNLTEEHIKLITNLDWSFKQFKGDEKTFNFPIINRNAPYGVVNNDIYRICCIILFGFKKDISSDDLYDYELTDERKDIIDKHLFELDIAMNIIMVNKTFEPGLYVKRTNDVIWKKKGGK